MVATREMFRDRRRVRRERERWASLERTPRPAVFDAASDRADLLAVLRELPERQRGMVVARFFYGLT